MGGRRGVERRGTPTRPTKAQTVSGLGKNGKPDELPAELKSWWAQPGTDFADMKAKREQHSWGAMGHVSSTSLAHGENEITRPRAPKPSEFAPGKK